MQQVNVKNETPNKKSYTKLWFHAPLNNTHGYMSHCHTHTSLQWGLEGNCQSAPIRRNASEGQGQTNGNMKGCW